MMRRLFAVCMLLGVVSIVVGCDKKSEVKNSTTVTTPEGSTKTTDTKTVETSGQRSARAK